MIGKDYVYNWLDMSDSNSTVNKFIITGTNKTVKLDTSIFPRVNYHGDTSSFTLARGRLFTFDWVLFWETKVDRQVSQDKLASVIKPVWSPSSSDTWFETLIFKTDWGTELQVQAKVFSMPTFDEQIADWFSPTVNFTFELYSEDPTLSWIVDIVESGYAWIYAGVVLWNSWVLLDDTFTSENLKSDSSAIVPTMYGLIMDDVINSITLTNDWNFFAPCEIVITGSIINPRSVNFANSRFFQIDETTTNLIVDNRSRPFTATDEWVNVLASRSDGSKFIYVEPWDNIFLVVSSNFDWDDQQAVAVSVTFRDTYLIS